MTAVAVRAAPLPHDSAARVVSRPHDPDELQADRAAEVVMRGGSVAGWTFSGAAGAIRRRDSGAAPERAFVDDALATPGRPLAPATRETMEDRFGYDFAGVRVHDGARAAAAAERVGAAAFAVEEHLVLGAGRRPEGRLLAHELAHVVQHGHGGGGVVHRYTAYSPGDQASGASRGWHHPAAAPMRVSDDGQMASDDNGWGEGLNKRAWTTPALISASNGILSSQGSRANLRAKPGGATVSGTAPDTGAAATLTEIEPFNPGGGAFSLASDCGHACRQITGSGPAGRDVAALSRPARPGSSGTGGAVLGGILGLLAGGAAGAGLGYLLGPVGAIVGGIVGAIGGLIGGIYAGRAIARSEPEPAREEYLTPRTYHGRTSPTTPEEYSGELFQRELGGATRADALGRYYALSPGERDAFDRRHGINAYAAPRVGQGLTIGTEYSAPGYSDPSGSAWNFHYAATVLTSGDDYMTLENAAEWDEFTGWIFYLYGPARKGQSFHEEQAATGTHGSHHTSFVVQPERLLDVRVLPAGATLRTASGPVPLTGGTLLRVLERRAVATGGVEYLVRVTAGPNAGAEGLVVSGAVR